MTKTNAKAWEEAWATRLPPEMPWIVRLDGRAFHSWTRGTERPFDDRLREIFARTSETLVKELGAQHAYTQSDEISLVMGAFNDGAEGQFGGKMQKLVTVTASLATAAFDEAVREIMPNHRQRAGFAMFDARVFSVPDRLSACEAIQERAFDAWRNAVQGVAMTHYGHRAIERVPNGMLLDKMRQDGHMMSDYPVRHTRGIAIVKRRNHGQFTSKEIENLPERHHARMNPDMSFVRTELARVEGPDYRDPDQAMQMVFGSECSKDRD